MFICMYLQTYVYAYLFIYIYIYIYMYIESLLFLSLCIYIFFYIYIFLCIYLCIRWRQNNSIGISCIAVHRLARWLEYCIITGLTLAQKSQNQRERARTWRVLIIVLICFYVTSRTAIEIFINVALMLDFSIVNMMFTMFMMFHYRL